MKTISIKNQFNVWNFMFPTLTITIFVFHFPPNIITAINLIYSLNPFEITRVFDRFSLQSMKIFILKLYKCENLRKIINKQEKNSHQIFSPDVTKIYFTWKFVFFYFPCCSTTKKNIIRYLTYPDEETKRSYSCQIIN
jgi:hypothetical protein